MKLRTSIYFGSMLAALLPVSGMAQQPGLSHANPAPGCSVTPAQLEANKKVVIAFFTPGSDRMALADPSYKQHNPAFKKRAAENHVSDYEEYKAAFSRAGNGGPRPGNGGPGNAGGQRLPGGNLLEVVTAECDIVTVIHKIKRPVPGGADGEWYEFFTFDTFRVKDGKLVEHWDGSMLPMR